MGHPNYSYNQFQLKQRCLAAGHGEAEVLISKARGHASARRAVEESDLDEEWFVDFFQGVLLLGQGCGQRAQADRAAVVFWMMASSRRRSISSKPWASTSSMVSAALAVGRSISPFPRTWA